MTAQLDKELHDLASSARSTEPPSKPMDRPDPTFWANEKHEAYQRQLLRRIPSLPRWAARDAATFAECDDLEGDAGVFEGDTGTSPGRTG